jgi:hypothetical protein
MTKLLCWLGWHKWEYVYYEEGYAYYRGNEKCSRCGRIK